ncbi:hypothetical protein ACPOL_4597 [Acidisarcina polymorpha]|uniref:Uncharacterized protein n=1 Tax=Acidisarcina polymorpha TaxID=2211140 RepID=A0A2Z5G4B5_9BACT|nr:hypothetical protein ACPOL_4597 [Acidisarcina polymorpha]
MKSSSDYGPRYTSSFRDPAAVVPLWRGVRSACSMSSLG